MTETQDCVEANCGPNGPSIRVSPGTLPERHQTDYPNSPPPPPPPLDLPLRMRLHLPTPHHALAPRPGPPYLSPIVQYHGKWPFYRFLGIQEPASVLFSLLNLLAHDHGITKLKQYIPASYKLRKYYLLFGYFGLASWTFSMLFHTRDFVGTEKLDYFASGASVMYGMYFAPIRIFRLDKPDAVGSNTGTLLRLWTALCVALYLAHVGYLSFVRFDYTYNMAANIAVGVVQNILWTSFSIQRFRKVGRMWAAWPGLIVAWIVLAMSLELFDFPPWWGMLDAHALWHLGTVGPTIWWYK